MLVAKGIVLPYIVKYAMSMFTGAYLYGLKQTGLQCFFVFLQE
jgi:hypothetical protein